MPPKKEVNMPSKKRKTEGQKDIRFFFNKDDHQSSSNRSSTEFPQPGGAAASETVTGCQRKVKQENEGDTEGEHLHRFIVKFRRTDRKVYTVDCDQRRTVLDAIKSSGINKMKKMTDENIIIQLGKEDQDSIVATHFPCSCIENGESLIVLCKQEKVEEAKCQLYKTVHPRNKYSVFYIDTKGGVHTRTKELFRSNAVKQFNYVCVYGEKGMTVEEALTLDGRFIDDLGKFTLSDNDDPDVFTLCSQRVDNLHQKSFKICLPLNKPENDEKEQENSRAYDTKEILDLVQQRATSVKTALEKAGSDNEQIYKILRQQFPGLKELMESRFPGDSYQEVLKLRKENFGKIQKSFSEVHRIKNLLKLAKSVCKLVVKDVCKGTAFVLFDNFILTNAHLFKDCVEKDQEQLQEHIDVFALFNYEEPVPSTNFDTFTVKRKLIDIDWELDYAILEFNPERYNINTRKKKVVVPPGLLKNFGPVPPNGEACIIGHPAGDVKKMDPICIIEKENRGKAVEDQFKQHCTFVVYLINNEIKNQGIENIMMGGNKENVVTYNTFMYHGSSGSPVFDAHGQIFGLHTAGYYYDFKIIKDSVIEYAQPLLDIFENFVSRLKESGKEDLMKRVEQEAKDNPYLKKALKDMSSDSDKPMDVDE